VSDLKTDLAGLRIERGPERAATGRWIGWTVFVLLLAAAGVAGYKWLTRDRPIEVDAATVTERAAGTQAAVLNASGYVVARRRATVSSKVTGKVIEVNVDEGMAVHEGQILARLDDSAAQAALALGKAQLESARQSQRENQVRLDLARVTLARSEKLIADGVGTRADFDSAKAEVDAIAGRIRSADELVHVAERQVELQQTDLDNTIIRAPFTGIAISKDAQPGEMVSPISAGGGFTRTGICTIVDMHSLEVEVDVNENYIGRVKTAQEVTAILNAYPDWQIPARVITVIPTADRQKATVLVRIAFKQLDPRILPDMGVKVTFLREETTPAAPNAAVMTAAQPTVLAPKAAVITDGNQSFVFLIRGDTVERRAVRTGGTDGDRLEIVAGLRGGDRVVLSPPPTIADGVKIIVK
jgi:RND family efflux transporter MFP subunit